MKVVKALRVRDADSLALTVGQTGAAHAALLLANFFFLYKQVFREVVHAIHPNATTYIKMMAHTAAVNIGVFFGIYPAFRAANLHPMVALRYE